MRTEMLPRVLFSGMEWFPVCRDGGLNRYFYESIEALAEVGVKGAALVSYAEPSKVGEIAIRGMAAKGAPLWRRWWGGRTLALETFKHGVDVANAHFALYTLPWLRDLPTDVALVSHFHGPWSGEMRAEAVTVQDRIAARAAHWLERAGYLRSDRIVTLSAAFRDLLHGAYGVPLGKIRVVPGGVDLTRYLAAPEKAAARGKMGWPQDRRILLSIRRLVRRMGLDLLVDAVAEVRREYPDVLLLIGGKGAEEHRLKAQIDELGLAEHVRLLGFVPESDLPIAYAAADVSVVPTVALEGFGLITVESLAAGTPVLGTAVGGTSEILQPFRPELLFADATAGAMAEKLRAVLRGSVTLPDRAACRAHAQRYGWPAVVPQLMAVFQEAIGERRRRS